jgi:hypothetical protein
MKATSRYDEIAAFRRALVCATELLFNQYRLHPHVYRSVLPFSRSLAIR